MSTLKVNRIEPRTGDSVEIVGFSGGKILQVVQGVYSTQIVTSSETYVTSELKASITPSSTSSKILVIAKVTAFYNSGGGGDETGGAMALFRDGANILDRCGASYSASNGTSIDAGVYFLDAPSSTSSLNYEIYFKKEWGGNQFCHDGNSPSSIILMEVAG